MTPAEITSRRLMTVNIIAASQQKFGAVPYGVRSFVPVTGGDFDPLNAREHFLATRGT